MEEFTPSIGAQLLNVNLGDASRDADLADAIHALLLQYRVLFLRDQDISPPEHVHFASRFGELEATPWLPSHPEEPGLVQIHKTPDTPRTLRERLALRRHLAGMPRRWAASCAASSAPRPAATPSGPTWSWPTRTSRKR